jgi:hypothetical protein
MRKRDPKLKQHNSISFLDVETMADFVVMANTNYDLGYTIPESWPEGTILAHMWALEVDVVADIDGTAFHAMAKKAYPTIGALGGGSGIAGRFCAKLTTTGEFRIANSSGGNALSLIDLIKENNHG